MPIDPLAPNAGMDLPPVPEGAEEAFRAWLEASGLLGHSALPARYEDLTPSQKASMWRTWSETPDGKRLLGTPDPSELGTRQADEDRARLQQLLEQLQQQAATGGGAWEQAFRQATQKANAATQAIGQSTPGAGYQSSLRNIANAQGAGAQMAVGQEEILRQQQRQAAQEGIAELTAAQGAGDIDQSVAQARARQAKRGADIEEQAQKQKTALGVLGGLGQTYTGLASASQGGQVPGEPAVFGDDQRNDTVPAMLSPGEIVVPRSKADNPEEAADFARAIAARGYADGGSVFGGPGAMPPTVETGAMLEKEQVEQSRKSQLDNEARLRESIAGRGPSVARQQIQNATDAALIAAMQAQASKRAPASDLVSLTGQAAQAGAGQAGQTVARETGSSQDLLMRSILGQRARDLTLARAEQEALWRNDLMNRGIGLQQQALLANILGGAGQAAGILSSAGASSVGRALNRPPAPLAQPGSVQEQKAQGMSDGGLVMDEDELRRSREFVESLRRAA